MKFRFPKLSTIVFIALFFIAILIDLPKNSKIKPLVIDVSIFEKKIHKEFDTKLGLDLKGGSHLVFEGEIGKLPAADRADALASARDIIEKRVNFFGVTEPNVQTAKSGNSERI